MIAVKVAVAASVAGVVLQFVVVGEKTWVAASSAVTFVEATWAAGQAKTACGQDKCAAVEGFVGPACLLAALAAS